MQPRNEGGARDLIVLCHVVITFTLPVMKANYVLHYYMCTAALCGRPKRQLCFRGGGGA